MASESSRKLIAAIKVSLDGFIQGPDGEKDWADSWASALQLIPDVDMFVLGGRMYPDYGAYWESIEANPDRVPPFQEQIPTKSEVAYARLAVTTPHIVLSTTLTSVSWPPTAQVIRTQNPQESTGKEHVCRRRSNPGRNLAEREPDR